MTLKIDGLAITDESKELIWSTPPLSSPVSALLLLETGNLVLVDENNVSLWQSFDYPTDTIVTGQRFLAGKSLVSASSADDFSSANYSLTLNDENLVLQWFGQTYWKLSMETRSFKLSNNPVSYMEIISDGLYLYGGSGNESFVVLKLLLSSSSFSIARIGYGGRFTISSSNSTENVYLTQELLRPSEFCLVPNICGELGFCTLKQIKKTNYCTCLEGFKTDSTGCSPIEKSISLPTRCNGSSSGRESESASSVASYMNLGTSFQYIANDFSEPAMRGVDLSVCQDLCSQNCSCLGFFYRNSSGSCYPVENHFGSVYDIGTTESEPASRYIKVFEKSSPSPGTATAITNKKHGFPVIGIVFISLSGFGLIVIITALAILWLHRKRTSEKVALSLGRWDSSSSTAFGITSIPGLPSSFKYEEIEKATDDFSTQIGSGGFGTVYKGTMADETKVAIKKIKNLGVRGKEEFFTELRIIGSIHHVNLVRLIGFCVHRSCRFLVYEFMSRGSLERILFGDGPVLEWRDRYKIVLGTARALAYLHSGCQQKIIHCDIKPENILLSESLQVKVSDFGLSKLLDHETSRLLTTLRGTRGYLAPEWITSSGITDKTDVYSFGMVLLEIVSGKRNCPLLAQNTSIGTSPSSSSLEGATFFPALAFEMHKERRYSELADPRLEGRVSGEEIEKIVRIALCCLHIVPTLRPSMQNVVDMLEGRIPIGNPIVYALNFLLSFGGGQN